MPDLIPGALVFWLFLAPDYFPGLWPGSDSRRVVRHRKRVKLLDAYDCHVFHVPVVARIDEIVINLAAAENDPLDRIRPDRF